MNLRSENSVAGGSYAFANAINIEEIRQHLSEQHEPPALSLDEKGMIVDCSKSFRTLFGFRRSDLVWKHVSTLFPQFEGVELVQGGQVNSMLNYLSRCGKLYEAKNRQGDTLSINLSFVPIENKGKRIVRMIVHQV
jgi:PAS domain S-box-containing protein